MKKLLLSLAVIVAFILYSGYVKNSKTQARVVFPSITPTDIMPTHPALTQVITDTPPIKQGKYKDGTYTGTAVDVFYGFLQVQAVVQNGELTDVKFLRYPDDRQESIEINTAAMPILRQEAIESQKAQVDLVSGATDSSRGFVESLDSALSQAI